MNKFKRLLYRIYDYIIDNHAHPLDIDVDADLKFLNELAKKYGDYINRDNAQSFYYRSFLQYKCRMIHVPLFNRIFLHGISISIFPIFIILTVVNKWIYVHSYSKESPPIKKITALDLGRQPSDMTPAQLKKRFDITRPHHKNFVLEVDSLKLILTLLIKFRTHPFFLLMVSINLSLYNYLIIANNPSAIISYKEFSFSSSILTYYLESKGVMHINIMHGEKLINIRDSFFRFSEFWVWDSHYSDMLKKLWAYPNQFRIGQPEHHLALKKLSNISQNITLKFYWGSERDRDELKYISNILAKFQNSDRDIIIRYHPSHKEFFYKNVLPFFKQFSIENPLDLTIYESLATSTHILGTYSTVLYEARLMDKKIVINDYADNFQKLIKLNYILAKDTSVIPLSQLIGNE